jgi:hypothetical protein
MILSIEQKDKIRQVPMAHACNPSYSGGRDQDTEFQNQPGQIVCKSLSRKNPSQKRWWGWCGTGEVTQGVGSEFKPSAAK